MYLLSSFTFFLLSSYFCLAFLSSPPHFYIPPHFFLAPYTIVRDAYYGSGAAFGKRQNTLVINMPHLQRMKKPLKLGKSEMAYFSAERSYNAAWGLFMYKVLHSQSHELKRQSLAMRSTEIRFPIAVHSLR